MTEAVQKPARPPEELSFEEALAELEALTSQMASGTVTLEESVKGYERGAKLLLRCRSELARAREAIERSRAENPGAAGGDSPC